MEVSIVEEGGFCFGVRRAIRLANEATCERSKVYSLGPLIHNRHVIEELAEAGLTVADDISQVPDGAVVMIRAHGAGPEVYQQAQARNMQIIDATCPFVDRVQRKARQFTEMDYQVLVLGEADHPEPKAIVEHSQGQAIIVEGPQDLQKLSLDAKVAVVAQTTQPRDSLEALVVALLPEVEELIVANTICEATTTRQQASVAKARQVDLMIVVGGYHSANTRRLAQICQATGTATHHIETAAEIDLQWLNGAATVGVTAGASTPLEAVQTVAARLRELAENKHKE